MIRVVDLWHHYGTRPTLQRIDLTIERGALLCVMGPNGSASTMPGHVSH